MPDLLHCIRYGENAKGSPCRNARSAWSHMPLSEMPWNIRNSTPTRMPKKAGKRPPSAGAHPFTRQTCTERFETKSGLSHHERHRHPELANKRRTDAGKREAERKRELRIAAKAKRRKDPTLEKKKKGKKRKPWSSSPIGTSLQERHR